MHSVMSLAEWPWLIQSWLNWLPKILSDPISISFKIKDFCFSLSPGSGYCHSLWELQYSLRVFRLVQGESITKAIFVSLRVKMKRFNIDLFIPSNTHSSVFDLPCTHICRHHFEIQQKQDWSIILKWMAPQNIAVVKWNEIKLLGRDEILEMITDSGSKPDAAWYGSNKNKKWCYLYSFWMSIISSILN